MGGGGAISYGTSAACADEEGCHGNDRLDHQYPNARSVHWVRPITPNSGHSGISIAERAVRLHNSGIGMTRIQFCRFRPRGRILRFPTRILDACGMLVRVPKIDVCPCGFPAHSYKKPSTSVRVPGAGMRRSAQRRPPFFWGGGGEQSVTNSSRSFTLLNSAHSGRYGI